jgi:membrane protease YdiL (CAAX protease family)
MIHPLLDKFINIYLIDNLISYYISGSIVRFVIFLLAILAINKLKLKNFVGLTWNLNCYRTRLLIIHFIFFAILLFFVPYKNLLNYKLLSSFILYQLFVGFAEEFSIRGLLLPIIIKLFNQKKYAVYYGLIISSFIFAILHYLSFISGSQNFESATNQAVFAFGVGVYFGSLLLRTNNLILISFFHTTINFIGSFNDITFNSNQISNTVATSNFTINFIYVISSILIAIGLYLMKKVNLNIFKT